MFSSFWYTRLLPLCHTLSIYDRLFGILVYIYWKFFFCIVCWEGIETLLDLQPTLNWICSPILFFFILVEFLGIFLYIRRYHEQRQFHFSLSYLDTFYFLFLPILLLAGLIVLFWTEVLRAAILVLFLILDEKFSTFYHWLYNIIRYEFVLYKLIVLRYFHAK